MTEVSNGAHRIFPKLTPRRVGTKEWSEEFLLKIAGGNPKDFENQDDTLDSLATIEADKSVQVYGVKSIQALGTLLGFARDLSFILRLLPKDKDTLGVRSHFCRFLESCMRRRILRLDGEPGELLLDVVNRVYNAVEDSPFGRSAE